jgi:BlaI family penicillinase repressor
MPEEKDPARKSGRTKTVPRISDAEWVVMKVLWDKGPQTTNQVVAALAERMPWKPKTVHTLLSRLARKRALAYERKGREYLFRPRVSMDACEHAVMRSFLGRFFEGELAPFLARFMERERLKPEDIAELKRILEGKNT